MTAAVEQSGLARVRSRASFAYVQLFLRRQAPVALFLMAVCLVSEILRWRIMTKAGFGSFTLAPLALAGVALAQTAARDRTAPNAEYLRSLPLTRGSDVLAPVWVGACWATFIGMLLFVVEWTSAAAWLFLEGRDEGSVQVTSGALAWPPLITLGCIWFSYWAMSLTLLLDPRALRSLGRGEARPRPWQTAKNLRLILAGAQIALFLVPLILRAELGGGANGAAWPAAAVGLFYILVGSGQMRWVVRVAREVDLDELAGDRGARR